MARTENNYSVNEIQSYLKGVKYPAKKSDLLNAAKTNQASNEIMREISEIEGDYFAGQQEVIQAYEVKH